MVPVELTEAALAYLGAMQFQVGREQSLWRDGPLREFVANVGTRARADPETLTNLLRFVDPQANVVVTRVYLAGGRPEESRDAMEMLVVPARKCRWRIDVRWRRRKLLEHALLVGDFATRACAWWAPADEEHELRISWVQDSGPGLVVPGHPAETEEELPSRGHDVALYLVEQVHGVERVPASPDVAIVGIDAVRATTARPGTLVLADGSLRQHAINVEEVAIGWRLVKEEEADNGGRRLVLEAVAASEVVHLAAVGREADDHWTVDGVPTTPRQNDPHRPERVALHLARPRRIGDQVTVQWSGKKPRGEVLVNPALFATAQVSGPARFMPAWTPEQIEPGVLSNVVAAPGGTLPLRCFQPFAFKGGKPRETDDELLLRFRERLATTSLATRQENIETRDKSMNQLSETRAAFEIPAEFAGIWSRTSWESFLCATRSPILHDWWLRQHAGQFLECRGMSVSVSASGRRSAQLEHALVCDAGHVACGSNLSVVLPDDADWVWVTSTEQTTPCDGKHPSLRRNGRRLVLGAGAVPPDGALCCARLRNGAIDGEWFPLVANISGDERSVHQADRLEAALRHFGVATLRLRQGKTSAWGDVLGWAESRVLQTVGMNTERMKELAEALSHEDLADAVAALVATLERWMRAELPARLETPQGVLALVRTLDPIASKEHRGISAVERVLSYAAVPSGSHLVLWGHEVTDYRVVCGQHRPLEGRLASRRAQWIGALPGSDQFELHVRGAQVERVGLYRLAG